MKDLDPLITMAERITSRLTQATQKLVEQVSGYPAGGSGGGSSSGGSDRTGTLATRRAELGPERTDSDYRRCSEILAELDDIIRRAMPNTRTTEHVASTTADVNPGCLGCKQVGTWSPRQGSSDLCSPCSNLLQRIEGLTAKRPKLPPVALVERQRQGKKPSDSDVIRAMRKN